MDFHLLTLLLPAAIMLHVTEEFLFPGGFIEWYQQLVPSKTGSRPGYLVWINTLMIGVCVLPVWLGSGQHAVNSWYTVATIAGINACFHIVGVASLKSTPPAYSPAYYFTCPCLGGAVITLLLPANSAGRAL